MDWDSETLENFYYAGAALVVAYLTWNGWRQGLFRQLTTLVAIASAYLAGYFGASAAAPLFTFLRYPEPVTVLIAGTVTGLLTFIVISTLGQHRFKKTAQLSDAKSMRRHGIFGATVGMLFGAIIFFFASQAVRVLAVVARSDVEAADQEENAAAAHPGRGQGREVSPLVRNLAKLGSALDSGESGTLLKKYDPMPARVLSTLTKLSKMVAHPEAVDRFLSYPGITELTNHPKLQDLRMDPQVSELLANGSYFRLLRHEKVVALASDPDFSEKIKRTDFDRAIDYALAPTTTKADPGQVQHPDTARP